MKAPDFVLSQTNAGWSFTRLPDGNVRICHRRADDACSTFDISMPVAEYTSLLWALRFPEAVDVARWRRVADDRDESSLPTRGSFLRRLGIIVVLTIAAIVGLAMFFTLA